MSYTRHALLLMMKYLFYSACVGCPRTCVKPCCALVFTFHPMETHGTSPSQAWTLLRASQHVELMLNTSVP